LIQRNVSWEEERREAGESRCVRKVKTSVSLLPLKININAISYWLLAHLETFSLLILLDTSSVRMICHVEMMLKEANAHHFKCSRVTGENQE
jgi:hypothetical protein